MTPRTVPGRGPQPLLTDMALLRAMSLLKDMGCDPLRFHRVRRGVRRNGALPVWREKITLLLASVL